MLEIKKELREYKMRVGYGEILDTVYDESYLLEFVKIPFLNTSGNRCIKKILSKIYIADVVYTDYTDEEETLCSINYEARFRWGLFPLGVICLMAVGIIEGVGNAIHEIKHTYNNYREVGKTGFTESVVEK